MPTTDYPVYVQTRQYAIEQYVSSGKDRTDTYINNSSNTDLFGGSWHNRKEAQSNPNWKIKVAKKQDASTPYFRRLVEVEPGTYLHKYQRRYISPPYMTITGSDTCVFSPVKSISSMAYEDAALADIAVQRLKRKLNNRTQSYNTIIPLAELRELRQTVDGAATATMKVLIALADVKKTLKRSLRTIKDPSKLRKSLRNAYKDASDIWLTYSFGISPMMGTILDINKSISSYLTRYDSIDRLTGSATKEWKNSHVSDNEGTSPTFIRKRIGEEQFKLEYKYIAGHKFLLESANDYGALDHFGFKPASLVPAAWELTAFSWVVDYFTTAGAFLDDTFTGTSGNSIYVVKNRRFTYKNSTLPYIRKSGTTMVYYSISTTNVTPATINAVEFRREVLSAYPPRVLRFRTLDEIGLNGVSKLLNLASVLSKSF